jgi:cadmium resistance protein CadD (predicted permease)
VNVGNGSKVTVPFALTVYVPWFATVNVVKLQLAFAVEVVAHNFTVLATNVAGEFAVSFASIEIV